MKKHNSVSITASGYGNNADTLKKVLETVPAGSKYDLSYSAGDRPWESGSFTITLTWDEEL